LHSIT